MDKRTKQRLEWLASVSSPSRREALLAEIKSGYVTPETVKAAWRSRRARPEAERRRAQGLFKALGPEFVDRRTTTSAANLGAYSYPPLAEGEDSRMFRVRGSVEALNRFAKLTAKERGLVVEAWSKAP